MPESRIYLTPGDWALLSSLAFGTMLLYLFVVIYGTVGSQDRFIRFDAPGVVEFDLEWAGTYIVYQEFQRTPDNLGVIRPATTESLIAGLQRVDDGSIVDVTPAPEGHEYKIQRVLAEGVYQFVAPTAGKYRFATEYADLREPQPLRLVIIPTPAGRALRVFFVGSAMTGGLFVAVLALAYGLNHRGKRRAERATAS